MRRRTFLGTLGAALGCPLSAQAQRSATAIVGFLHGGSLNYNIKQFTPAVAAGLKEQGFTVGENVTIEPRAAEGHYERLPGLVAELIDRKVSLILAVGGTEPAEAAKTATSTLPIVFLSGADPVATGLVASLAHPGGNVTGVTLLGAALEAKRLQILHELAPGAALVAALVNPHYPAAARQKREIETAAQSLGVRVEIEATSTTAEIDAAVAKAANLNAGALLVAQDPFLAANQQRLVELAAQYKLPAIYQQREFVDIGGLASYGTDYNDAYRQAGNYIGRILKGARPADLPIVEPTKFALALNAKTAKTLGIALPPLLLAQADDVVE